MAKPRRKVGAAGSYDVLEKWHEMEHGRYAVKCDDCKVEIRRTDSIPESAAGGRCGDCK